MSISERLNPNDLNIHQFQEVPEARRELPFDVDRDIDWPAKQSLLDQIKTSSSTINLCYLVKCLKILWPKEPMPDMGDRFCDDRLIELFKSEHGRDVFNAAAIRAANPDLDLNVTQKDWKNLENDYASHARNIPLMALTGASMIKLFDPEHEVLLAPNELERIKTIAQEFMQKGDWKNFIVVAANLRLLDENYNPNINSEDWIKLRGMANQLLGHADLINVKILAAHSVKITAPGVIDIQMYPPEDITTQTPPVPETRKF